ncbi:hypothetical protein [Ferrimonas sp. SCSIO 43195]|uniref:hypothetical protein n=1 Tax=Ferrimonas sp. SCSIO 43195 TaxID=2822844 RepID=UPI002075A65C|nr:hypothetical protein [Ferrimonas sp. SCSIO 43195]USD36072.1 hypothetical protein J8Z22_13615 [Ferrimonas sp. SCSIO 43195]
MQRVEFIYRLGGQGVTSIWASISKLLERMTSIDSLFFYGVQVSLETIGGKLAGRDSFNVSCGNLTFHVVTVANYDHVLFQVESQEDDIDWSSWIDEFIGLKGFVQAWIVDVEYDYWQNASDPLEYKSTGKSYEGLPMKSNGLPPPLEQLEIDTSKNVGLRLICDGYVASIGAKMWFSDWFLSKINRKIENIIEASGGTVELLDNGVYKLEMLADVFESDNTIDQQIKLRNALYN